MSFENFSNSALFFSTCIFTISCNISLADSTLEINIFSNMKISLQVVVPQAITETNYLVTSNSALTTRINNWAVSERPVNPSKSTENLQNYFNRLVVVFPMPSLFAKTKVVLSKLIFSGHTSSATVIKSDELLTISCLANKWVTQRLIFGCSFIFIFFKGSTVIKYFI